MKTMKKMNIKSMNKGWKSRFSSISLVKSFVHQDIDNHKDNLLDRAERLFLLLLYLFVKDFKKWANKKKKETYSVKLALIPFQLKSKNKNKSKNRNRNNSSFLFMIVKKSKKNQQHQKYRKLKRKLQKSLNTTNNKRISKL